MLYVCWVEQVALIAVLIALTRRGLLKYYPMFGLFLAAKGTRSLCLLPLDEHDPRYGHWWAITAPVLMVLQMLVVLELTQKIVKHYPKLHHAAAKLIIGSCLTVGAVVGAISTLLQFGTGECAWYVVAAIGACKMLDWVSLGALAFLSLWLRLYRQPISRNVTWHRWLLVAYIGLAPGIALMLSTVGQRQRYLVDAANWALEITEICCCLGWTLALSQAGEAFPVVPKTISDEELAIREQAHQAVFSVLREELSLPELMVRRSSKCASTGSRNPKHSGTEPSEVLGSTRLSSP